MTADNPGVAETTQGNNASCDIPRGASTPTLSTPSAIVSELDDDDISLASSTNRTSRVQSPRPPNGPDFVMPTVPGAFPANPDPVSPRAPPAHATAAHPTANAAANWGALFLEWEDVQPPPTLKASQKNPPADETATPDGFYHGLVSYHPQEPYTPQVVFEPDNGSNQYHVIYIGTKIGVFTAEDWCVLTSIHFTRAIY